METMNQNRGFNIKALTDFSKLNSTNSFLRVRKCLFSTKPSYKGKLGFVEDELAPRDAPTKKHLKNVYSSLALAMFAAAAGGAVHIFTNFLKAGILCTIASIGLLLLLAFTPNNGKNQVKRVGYLIGFAFFTGIALGPLMATVTEIDSSIVPTAFFYTTLIFICFTVSALWAEERSFLYLGGMLASGVTILLVTTILNIFMRSYFLYQVHLYLGLVVFCAFILYDTQLIVEKFRRGDNDYVWHCVDLFMDFIAVFRRIMIILAQSKENKKKK